ncbi:Phosphatidylinositol-specific phospholipase C X domain-containing protein [Plasmodiophora brassicae]
MVASDAVERLSSWMTRAYREAGGIASLPLNELALPGSHNSASYAITSCSTVPAGDLGDSIRPFLKVPPVSAVISRWTKCQRYSVFDQLRHGIRYIDARVQYCPRTRAMSMCHGVCCILLQDCMRQIRAFLDSYPQEVVIVDFNHVYGADRDDHHDDIVREVVNIIGRDRVARQSSCLRPMTPLREFIDSGVQVVVIYDEARAAERADIWDQSCILSSWPNTDSYDRVLAHACEQARRREALKLHVMQLLFTPELKHIRNGLLRWRSPSSILRFAKPLKCAPAALFAKCREDPDLLRNLNVIIVDDCIDEDHTFVEATLAMNAFKVLNANASVEHAPG